ncbi:helix-turn-helix domain-containing protein [Streptomyces sp. NBC_00536]|uniref:helix-turn-helix domain-containing protein n=1 Tax=Streptomyces sp. NBC_00536 TaxID=2975769 RepID=UPI002E7FB5AB|nr:helix-turn-helix domain-containing protein [Streptomyces sp. NBC_00536]WUC79636.1 helix-turn-helix domain-containing protein [Streptomyces sp. NBC_00536]
MGTGTGAETERFAELMRELKERSGRSYGTLAKRLHSSNSTLHRYCNGQTVPTDYAPVERFARVCGASADELVALHHQWIVALAERRRESAGGGAPAATVPDGAAPDPASDPAPVSPTAEAGAPEPEPLVVALPDVTDQDGSPSPHEATPARTATGPGGRRRRLVALAAGVVVAMAAGTTVAVATLSGGTHTAEPSGAQHAAASESAKARQPLSAGAAAGTAAPQPTSPSGTPGTSAPTGTTPPGTTPSSGTPAPRSASVPFTVSVLTNNWGSPCGQWFALDQEPGKVPPPPARGATDGWASALHAVPAGHLRMEVTVQGTDSNPVVLHALYVHTVDSGKAPAWNGYTMGSGCGGELEPASFAIDLDAASPHPRPAPGHEGARPTPITDFPYKVSATDPQVLDIDASTLGHDVRWYLELAWSSGDRQGTTTIDDHGRPFRTTALTTGRQYWYNAGPNAWVPDAS